MFTEPEENTTLWRYLDLPKFCSMLQRKEVYFSNPNEFSDKREGKLLKSHEISMDRMMNVASSIFEKPYQTLNKLYFPDNSSRYQYIARVAAVYASKAGYENSEYIEKYIYNLERLLIHSDQKAISELGTLESKVNHHILASKLPGLLVKPISIYCWHENSGESESMWRIYGNKGLALKSTPAKLKSSLTLPISNETHSYISALNHVKYIDDPISIARNLMMAADGNSKPSPDVDWFLRHVLKAEIYKSYLLKHSAYRYENEVRYILQETENKPPDVMNMQATFNGKYIKADIEQMITEIVVSPYAEDWFIEVVFGVIEKEGVKLKLEKSSLNV
ncbi:DUF2971 domain-containing protein [Leptospira gomenensis]|uniref:DUF2971 domain-containing protein n=1 Tax=Leptospira gomenensis TaxID=2484974 RepID=A0A5F1YIH0_9LEPT|nr:DUF2971 domain-containing protein [Leptospira gomenensis]TGK38467.1 DUF2971 domain-containing protein [Leptospira gomenensis]TGK42582.1 DUF2971 domain-containing protein [Leptospira gomenensis]TGK55830.1 DUF2971 domain-containing protein [Leptospira gomenensis]